MPKHHYLPATYLARFSSDAETVPSRDRRLFVGDIRTGRVFSLDAGNAGCEKNFYFSSSYKGDYEFIEKLWSKYETGLSRAIDELINRTLVAVTWIRILVPFVTGMLIRGRDFDERFASRWKDLDDPKLVDMLTSKENANHARLMELQRLLAPVLAARWLVLEANGVENFILNDNGYGPYINVPTSELGYAIPVGKKHILGVIPERKRVVAYACKGKWYPLIEYHRLEKENHIEFNYSFSHMARRFLFGTDKAIIAKYTEKQDKHLAMPEPEQVGFMAGRLCRVHEFTWHRLVTVLESHPDSLDAWRFEPNWKAIADGWAPPVLFPANVPTYPSALYRHKNDIWVNLYDLVGFTTPPYLSDGVFRIRPKE